MTAEARRRPRRSATSPASGRRRRLPALLLVGLVAVVAGLGAWILGFTSVLAVDTVQVTGVARLSTADVLGAAQVPAGVPLARVDVSAVRARVAALGPVARVRVVRAWPDSLRIRVTERVPVGAQQQSDGSWLLLDTTATRFAASSERPPGYAEVPNTADPDVVLAAVRVLAELPATLLDQVGEVRATSPESVQLQLRSGRAVLWGEPGDPAASPARKAAVVQALLGRPGRTIDVASPGLAVVR